ncbi:hypothetical protein GGTG_09169 [Gaeumannomyces tritici R3-111a-1]|uniref:Uncharacterized protein n=1 Tax=Gaeumannomyces tritici (strain R3-111a-1) TaxID=644352 RepID=J3P6M7_GAET3|nr:hypothetical protein GGTG_09169 [Gaeumannomyces tritici R3-111a-1]EJT72303.1 hypothetical protein GGTG_09169 [Gaeumannomyces tritici R3-111a-1]
MQIFFFSVGFIGKNSGKVLAVNFNRYFFTRRSFALLILFVALTKILLSVPHRLALCTFLKPTFALSPKWQNATLTSNLIKLLSLFNLCAKLETILTLLIFVLLLKVCETIRLFAVIGRLALLTMLPATFGILPKPFALSIFALRLPFSFWCKLINTTALFAFLKTLASRPTLCLFSEFFEIFKKKIRITFNIAIFDIFAKNFLFGLIYVAISKVKSFNGIIFNVPFFLNNIRITKNIVTPFRIQNYERRKRRNEVFKPFATFNVLS